MPYEIVRKFERAIAEYAGANYAIAVSSATNALLLCCLYKKVRWVHIPKRTYPGVACSIMHAGGKVRFTNEVWVGAYKLRPYTIYDGALRFKRGMYVKGSLYCLSFHIKKHIPIGRGGMILCDNIGAVHWFKRMRFDGRSEEPLDKCEIDYVGYNMYMTPEQATRGLQLFNQIKDRDLIDLPVATQGYPDLSRLEIYK